MRQTFDIAHGVIAGVADGTARETRQLRYVRGTIAGQHLLQESQRISMFAFFDRFAGMLDLHAAIERLETDERPGTEEAITAEAFAVDHALEEKRPIAFLDLAEGADRRQRVADELAVNRHDAALFGQVEKS